MVEMADELNSSILRQLGDAGLWHTANEWGDRIADAAIVSKDPAVRAAAIEWRNFRARKDDDAET
jgi:hypothetical protein